MAEQAILKDTLEAEWTGVGVAIRLDVDTRATESLGVPGY